MSIRDKLDISAYLVIGSENCSRPVEEIVAAAVAEGFTCVQIRSKIDSAREMISILEKSARAIKELGKSDSVALLVDDRLDVVLAAREAGIKVDGVHVGQSDIPVEVCRKFLGEDSIVGLSARTEELIDYVKNADVSQIDYFGAGPLHETQTKPDCGKTADGKIITHDFAEIAELVKVSPIPVVVGGGVKLKDIPALAATKVQGFFVVSAVAGADNPRLAARELVRAWHDNL
ncbi:MAG: thiamine phosphate synthase [Selenomonadaceae bacterium]|nr:thiamine phosphate synthase [Selenomonadaceae bacterium]